MTVTRMPLERLGELPWNTLRDRLTALTCAWADLHGFHLAPGTDLPTAIPVTTHLWAWDDNIAVRVRIDVDRALTAVLHTHGEHTPATADAHDGTLEHVRVRVRPGQAWDPADSQVGRPDTPLPELDFQLLEITGPSPATFVRATPRTSNEVG
jgi:hypothetical protein